MEGRDWFFWGTAPSNDANGTVNDTTNPAIAKHDQEPLSRLDDLVEEQKETRPGLGKGKNVRFADMPDIVSAKNEAPTNLEDAKDLTQMLQILVGRIRKEIETVAVTRSAPFDPIANSVSEANYYTKQVEQDHKSYFVAELEEQTFQDEKEKRETSLRLLSSTAVDDIRYNFDRTKPKRQSSKSKPEETNDKKLLNRRWLSVLNTSEEEKIKAEFASRIEQNGAKFKKDASIKLEWVGNSKKKQTFRLKRLEHLLHLAQMELGNEIERKMQGFKLNRKHTRREIGKLQTLRTEASDVIMRLMHDYRIVSGREMGQYLQQAKDESEAFLRASRGARGDSKLANSSDRPNTTIGLARRSKKSNRKSISSSSTRSHSNLRDKRSQTAPGKSDLRPSTSQQSVRLSAMRSEWSQQNAFNALLQRQQESKNAVESLKSQKKRAQTSIPGSRQKPRSKSRQQSRRNQHPQQWGGWGSKLSFEAERILQKQPNQRPQTTNNKKTARRVDNNGDCYSQYSFLLQRSLAKST